MVFYQIKLKMNQWGLKIARKGLNRLKIVFWTIRIPFFCPKRLGCTPSPPPWFYVDGEHLAGLGGTIPKAL